MAAYTPVLILGGVSFVNTWYATKQIDLKIPVATAIAAALAAGFAKIPGAEPLVTGIGWVALVAWLVVTAGQPNSVVSTLASLTGNLNQGKAP